MNYDQIKEKSLLLLENRPITLSAHLEYLKLFGISPSWFKKMRLYLSNERELFELYLQAKRFLEKAPSETQEAFELLAEVVFSSELSQQLQFLQKNISPEKQMEERKEHLRNNVASVHPALVQPFFLSLELLSDSKQIDLQEKLLLNLSQRMYERERILTEAKEACYSPPLQADIAAHLGKLIKESFVVDSSLGAPVTEEKCESIAQKFEQFCERQEKQVAELRHEKEKRKKFFEENNVFIKNCEAKIAAFSFLKDIQPLSKQVEDLLSLLMTYEIQIHQIAEEDIANYFSVCMQEREHKKEEIQKLFLLLAQTEKQLFQDVATVTQTIKRRLFEIFSKNTPFPDLKPMLESLHNACVAETQKFQKKFFSGACTFQEYQTAIFSLAYDHDVRQLRKDVMFRSTRLKELRQECLKQFNLICRYHRYLRVCGEEGNALTIQSQELARKLYDLFLRLREPFELFVYADEVTYESVNAVFRAIWIELEEYQEQVLACIPRVKNLLQLHRKELERAFFRCISDVEESLKVQKTFVRGEPGKIEKQLLPALQLEFREVKDAQFFSFFEEKVKELEATYSFIAPFSFYLQCDFHELRISLLQQSYTLESRVREVYQFAKVLQSVKLYEEERVDEILEGFEELHTINEGDFKNAFAAYYNKLSHTADCIEREVVLEIGLVDRRAILDIEEKKLAKVLRQGIEVGCRNGKEEFQELPEEVCSHAVEEDADIDMLLAMMRALCHQFFEVKVKKAYALKSRSGCYEKLIIDLRHMLHAIGSDEVALTEVRTLLHCRELVERLEIQEERIELFNPILTEILNGINQIFKSPLSEKLHPILRQIDELRSRKEFINNSKTLLHYLPGCLRYFD